MHSVANANGQPKLYTDCHCNSYCHIYGNGHSHGDSHSNSHSHGNSNGKAVTFAEATSDTETSPDTGSATVSRSRKLIVSQRSRDRPIPAAFFLVKPTLAIHGVWISAYIAAR